MCIFYVPNYLVIFKNTLVDYIGTHEAPNRVTMHLTYIILEKAYLNTVGPILTKHS